MLLWVSLVVGLALILGAVGLVVSMARAERRARRTLYRSLGLAETTVEFLMERNRDVLTELTYVRHEGEPAVSARREAPITREQNVIFLRSAQTSAPNPREEPEDKARTAGRDSSSPDGHTRR